MCGIAGFIYPKNKTAPDWANEKGLSEMLTLIHHRGPDGQGHEVGQGYGLGHVRLSILDTSDTAHQPMWCPQKRYCLIYNGEIYNFRKIREELESKGFQFKSSGDTEVLLYALIHWGKDAFSKMEGMFAGVLYDTAENKALIFRDQLGIKPLYYSFKNGEFVFASEVKALRPALGGFSLNKSAMYEYTNFRYVAGENTLFEGIKRLLPGHYIEMDANGGLSYKQYYTPLDSIKQSKPALTNNQIKELVDQSIREHTVSDVGYSIQLSGGIDSSYITTLLSLEKSQIDTYSVSLPGDKDDESAYQKQVIEKCGTIHHDFACDGNMFADLLPKATYHLDFPIMHAGSVFLFRLCQEIAKDHKVVLTGEGADELLLGYSRYDIPLNHKIAFQLKRMGIPASLIPDLPKLRGLKALMQKPLGMDAGMFDSAILDDLLINQSQDIEYRKNLAKPFSSLVKQIMASDQGAYLGSLLERQDKVSMASSVESRVPFCSHVLFDAINPTPFSSKAKPVPKAQLKALLLNQYGKDFVYRRKAGFRLPIDQWIADKNLMGRYLDYLTDQKFKDRGVYNQKIIEMMITKHTSGEMDYSRELFGVINFEIWAKEFGV